MSRYIFRSSASTKLTFPSDEERSEQDGSGNGGQRPSFASLCPPSFRRATPLTFSKEIRNETENQTHPLEWIREEYF
jgi:hypothetical protein